MARQITITLTDSMEASLRKTSQVQGATIERVASEVLAGALGVIPTIPADPQELERLLVKGLEGEAREITRQEWDAITRGLIERHAKSKAG